MFDEKTCSLVVPNVEGKQPLLLPLRRILDAESRIQEVAIVNNHKAPELLAAFNEAFLDTKKCVMQLKLCLADATKAMNTRKSIVTLDLAPAILREKGLLSGKNPAGSEDLRQAVVDQDAEYLKCADRVTLIKAMIAYMSGKEEGIVMAYTSVKKILGDNSNNWAEINKNRNLSAGAPPVTDPSNPRSRFGG